MRHPMNPGCGWIWTSDPYDRFSPVLCLFRGKAVLSQKPAKAVSKITADSRYHLYVNGVSVCQGPCKGDGQVWYYEEVDLAPYLREGENTLAAVVLRYPQDHGNGNHAVWRMAKPGFFLESEVPALSSSENWKARLQPNVRIHKANDFFEPICVTEDASGDPETAGWYLPDYDDAGWKGAYEYGEREMSRSIPPRFMEKRPIPLLYETPKRFAETFCLRQSAFSKADWDRMLAGGSLEIPAHTAEKVEISAGELTTGYLQLLVSGGAGAKISIVCSESYGHVEKSPTGISFLDKVTKTDRCNCETGELVHTMTDTYAVSGYGTAEKPERYEPFWFRTFRFIRLEIETAEQPLALRQFSYRETGYPLRPETEVTTSDETLAPIWEISLRTLRRCMHETYEDCPFFEQLQYSMDSRSEILFTYDVAADDRMSRRTMDDFFRSQRADGLINCCYPSYGPNVIPGFSVYYILMIYDHMMYFGDKALVRKYMPAVDRILQFYDGYLGENGLVRPTSDGGMGKKYWSFVDWAPEWEAGVPGAIQKGPATFESLIYILGLQYAAKLADYLGFTQLSADYLSRVEAVKSAVKALCSDPDGMLRDGPEVAEYSQQVQVFAILTGVLTGEKAKEILLRTLSEKMPQCTVAMGYYLCRALEMTGLYDHMDKVWVTWRVMIQNHMTTCVESPGETARSDCHAWSALILHELPAVTLGVQPAAPGYAAVRVKPVPGYLTHAEGTVLTPRGKVSVRWTLKDGRPDVTVKAPDGVEVIVEA